MSVLFCEQPCEHPFCGVFREKARLSADIARAESQGQLADLVRAEWQRAERAEAQLAVAIKERDLAQRRALDEQDTRVAEAEVKGALLRAALEPTSENVQGIADEYCKQNGYKIGINWIVGRVLAAALAKATP